ncbi:MAG: DNA cytosine methyltransferase, partial [Thermoleophilia bacterium]|nr:DNA cytosine methyltransferase [Thermoleophilia bacterium]
PLRTVCSTNDKAVVTAFLAKHYGGVVGHDMGRPLGTVTGVDHHSLVTAHLTKFYGTNVGADMGEPMPTVTAEGWHLGEVRAFLVKYYGTAVAAGLGEPLDTVTTRDRFGLVTVRGEDYVIADIGLRMLQPRELARAQGFPDSYVLVGTKTAQVAAVGNSVPPPLAEAMVRANVRLAEAGVGAASTWSLPRPRGVASPQIRNRRTRA